MERKTKSAAALKYSLEKGGLPKVVASGKGAMADRIVEVAKANGIPVEEDAELAEMLASIENGNDIPAEAIVVVAEILAHIFRMNRGSSGIKG